MKDYLLWFTPALVFQMWTAVGLFVIRLDGAKLAMWCSVVAALLNVVLDWLFIFPLGWGVMGAAFATAISVSVGGVIVVVYLSFSHARCVSVRSNAATRACACRCATSVTSAASVRRPCWARRRWRC